MSFSFCKGIFNHLINFHEIKQHFSEERWLAAMFIEKNCGYIYINTAPEMQLKKCTICLQSNQTKNQYQPLFHNF